MREKSAPGLRLALPISARPLLPTSIRSLPSASRNCIHRHAASLHASLSPSHPQSPGTAARRNETPKRNVPRRSFLAPSTQPPSPTPLTNTTAYKFLKNDGNICIL